MTAYVSMPHGTVDIGILIGHKTFWGAGLGQDAWDTLIKWFIEVQRIRKVTAGALASNTAMILIMKRAGMGFEAVRPKQELFEGVPMDLHYYCKYGHIDLKSRI